MAETIICRRVGEHDELTKERFMSKLADLRQDGMFMKLYMARTIAQHVWINYNKLGKIAYHVKNLPEIFYSKSRARLSHAMHSIIAKNGRNESITIISTKHSY